MYCGACGQENPAGNNFCSACGKPFHSATERPPQNGRYSVILTATPEDEFERFRTIKQLAGLMERPETEAKALVENAPSILASIDGLAAAEDLQKRLSEVLVGTLIRPVGQEQLDRLRAQTKPRTQATPQVIPPMETIHPTSETPSNVARFDKAVGVVCLVGLLLFGVSRLGKSSYSFATSDAPPSSARQSYAWTVERVMKELSAMNRDVVASSVAFSDGTLSPSSASDSFGRCQSQHADSKRELEGLTPPSELASFHNLVVRALGSGAEACRLFKRGIDRHDSTMYATAESYQRESNRLLRAALAKFPE